MDNLKIITLKGKAIHPYITHLASLRIEVFKEYPYLYEGDMSYETEYLENYVNCSESVLVLVLDREKIVGASTALPLQFEESGFYKPFVEKNIDVSDIFYFGESILLPPYRGQGVYKHFFTRREEAARQYGAKTSAFCAVERDQNDPRRPENYLPLDNIWKKFGYVKHPELSVNYKWKEIGNKAESTNTLVFWLKEL